MNTQKTGYSHHDKFFKRFYSHPPFAKEIVRLLFSKKEVQKCDLSRLKVEKSSLKGRKMDLILSFPLKNFPDKQIRIVILFEHKSKYDKNLFKQVLRYQVELYENFKQTIAVTPALFYHGKLPWVWPLSFQEAVLGKFFSKIPRSMRKSMLNYGLRLLNTGDRRVQRLFRDRSFKTGRVFQLLDRVWFLKDKGNEGELREILFGFFSSFSDEWILAVAKYLRSAGVSLSLWKKLEREAMDKGLLNKGGYMDIREEIREEGRWEGRQEGRQEERQVLIHNMLREKADLAFISKVTGLSVQEIKKLKKE